MLLGEFESGKLLYGLAPDACPMPIGYGTYKSDKDSHFYLCAFHDMNDELPDVEEFCAKLAQMHKDSIAMGSPDGKYGFHVTTFQGNMPQDLAWCDTWEESFVRGLKRFMELEAEVHGESPEIKKLSPAFYEKVVPRLLRPLESGGREIKPCLLHGDIWYGNIATDVSNDKPIMFDPASYWAHNECMFSIANCFGS